ncbi:AMP-binding protein [Micromonospora sp. NPDC049171]|uniref:AMP-binding protein n=1 Tax=Micromonospora sp. NPDC049171 TaxID=3155770 RepID=UPI0033D6B356
MLIWDMLTSGRPRRSLRTWVDGQWAELPWAEVIDRAYRAATHLREQGVRPGSRVACVLTNTADAVAGLLAVWLAGGVVASLPLPSRGMSGEEYAGLVNRIIDELDADLLLLDDDVRAKLGDKPPDAVTTRSWASLAGPGERIDPALPAGNEICFIQFSSGSTGRPKGCALTADAVSRQLSMIHSMLGAEHRTERVASWLPLSHDMGIFGCLLYTFGFDSDIWLSSPERLFSSPRSWFRDLAEHGITMTAGTSTGLHLATRAQGRHPLSKQLALRVCVLGAERVDHAVLAAAVATFGSSGLRMEHFMPAYGLAEATLAVTACDHREKPRTIVLDAVELADGRIVETSAEHEHATVVVSVGRPCTGVTVETAAPGRLAEIIVRSPSLAEGYHNDPERTARVFTGGRLRTGDLGFLADGELYMVGRTDDMLSVGGRKVYARELEATVESLGTVREGCSVVLDEPGVSPGLVLLAELKRTSSDAGLVAAEAAAAIRVKCGIALTRCLFVNRNGLPRTPSGKIQRFQTRWLLEQQRLPVTATVDF